MGKHASSSSGPRIAASVQRAVYQGVMVVLWPLWRGALWWYFRKEERARERWGGPSKERPQGKLLWLHGSSIGEARALLSIADRVLAKFSYCSILITTQTQGGTEVLCPYLSDRLLHQRLPIDFFPYVRRFLSHWKPDAVCFFESEFWPEMILQAAGRGLPLFSLNARISEKSLSRWACARALLKSALNAFSLMLAPSDDERHRLAMLVDPQKIALIPSIKYGSPPLTYDQNALEAFRKAAQGKKMLLASCIHETEEELIFALFRTLRERHPELMLIFVPRHINRVGPIFELSNSHAFIIHTRTIEHLPKEDTDVFVFDTIGELGMLYADTLFTILGGSFVPDIGGHNILEPSALGCAVVHGPFMQNNLEVSSVFDAEGASLCAEKDTLVDTVMHLLDNPGQAEVFAAKAKTLFQSFRDRFETTMTTLLEALRTHVG